MVWIGSKRRASFVRRGKQKAGWFLPSPPNSTAMVIMQLQSVYSVSMMRQQRDSDERLSFSYFISVAPAGSEPVRSL